MTITTERMQGTIRDPDKLPRYAQYGLLAGVIGVSVTGWITAIPGYGGLVLAAFSACLEVLIFFGLPKWLDHFKKRRWAKLPFLTAILAMAAVLNYSGLDYGLQFIGTAMQAPIDAQVRAEQSRLDTQRGRVLDRISTIQAAQQGLATQAPPNAETTNTSRLREWRAIHNVAADNLSQQLEAARGVLDRLPLTVAPRYAYPVWARHVAAGFLFFISMFVRFAWGSEAPASIPARQSGRGKRPKQVSHGGGVNVIDLGTERDVRDKQDAETVRRLRQREVPYRQIEIETGISKSRAQRLLNTK